MSAISLVRPAAYLWSSAASGSYRPAQLRTLQRPSSVQVGRQLAHPAVASSGGSGAADYYQVLGFVRNADKEAIKSAYRNLSHKYHPDKNSYPWASEIFMRIKEAYDVLSDDDAKVAYDVKVDRHGRAGEHSSSGGSGSRASGGRGSGGSGGRGGSGGGGSNGEGGSSAGHCDDWRISLLHFLFGIDFELLLQCAAVFAYLGYLGFCVCKGIGRLRGPWWCHLCLGMMLGLLEGMVMTAFSPFIFLGWMISQCEWADAGVPVPDGAA